MKLFVIQFFGRIQKLKMSVFISILVYLNMEVATYISLGAVVAFAFSKLVSLLQVWYSLPSVQQIVNMTIILRNSLPPAVRMLGSTALTFLKPIFTGLIEILAALPPIVVQALHLVGHLIYQLVILAKNIYTVVIATGKGLYVVLQTANEGFAYVWNFSENILNPLTNWMFAQPIHTVAWQRIMMILLLSACISITKRYLISPKRKLKQG